MLSSLKNFLARMIKRYEGGYVWDKNDPGGPTKYGVTWRALAEHRGQPAGSASEWAQRVKDMTIDEAVTIYEQKYAPPIKYNELPLGVDVAMMDYGVNSGPARPKKVACAIVGTKTYDADTVAKIKAYPANIFISKMCDERLAFMKALKGGKMWEKYKGGWGSRVADLRSYALSLATGATITAAPDLSQTPTPKAEVVKPSATVPNVSGGLGGVVTTGLGYFTALPWLYIGLAVGAIIAVVVVIHIMRDIQHAKEDQVHL